MISRNDFDIETIKSYLDYEEYSGKLFWKVSTGKAKKGNEAGSLSTTGYLKVTILGRCYIAHRVAWAIHYGVAPPGIIDHINGIGTDNRISNLRDGTACINQQNQKTAHSRNKSSRFLGVSKFKGRWRAKIYHNKTYHFLGFFSSEIEASEAYISAKNTLHAGSTL